MGRNPFWYSTEFYLGATFSIKNNIYIASYAHANTPYIIQMV